MKKKTHIDGLHCCIGYVQLEKNKKSLKAKQIIIKNNNNQNWYKYKLRHIWFLKARCQIQDEKRKEKKTHQSLTTALPYTCVLPQGRGCYNASNVIQRQRLIADECYAHCLKNKGSHSLVFAMNVPIIIFNYFFIC